MTSVRIVFVNFPVKVDSAEWPQEVLRLKDYPSTKTLVFSILPEGRKENADFFKAHCAIQHQVFTWENLSVSQAAEVTDIATRGPLLFRSRQSAAVLVRELEVMPDDLSPTTIESLTTSSCQHLLAALSAGAQLIASQGENTNWKKPQRQKWNNHMKHLRLDLDNALSSLRFGVGVGPASSGAALKRSIQDQLGRKPLDFSTMLSSKQKMPPGFYMQPGLGDEHQSTEEALLKVLGNLQHQCVQKVMQGEIRNPRIGKLLPDNHNDGKSRILFQHHSWTSSTDISEHHPKSCVVWISRARTVQKKQKKQKKTNTTKKHLANSTFAMSSWCCCPYGQTLWMCSVSDTSLWSCNSGNSN